MFCCIKRRHSTNGKVNKESNQYVEKFLLQHGSLAPRRYKYSEIKKITKSFSDKLGKGGYGSVYKGMLPDGSPVAVKVLMETDSISRTSHVNIVALLGFCYEGSKRALVYEFIRIVHFDIKPQNILLDQDLTKLCRKKQSMLSMLGMRGTIGYIAPEVFSRNFGGVSHKSDVYSYGMMVGAKNDVETHEVAPSSDNYFPDKINVNNKSDDLMIEEEEETRRKMFLIGFWCIPSDRPSMSKLVVSNPYKFHLSPFCFQTKNFPQHSRLMLRQKTPFECDTGS